MTGAKILLCSIAAVYTLTVFIFYIKSKRFFTALILTALQGICALTAVNLAGGFIGVHLPVNALTLGVSSLGGVSGVIALLLCAAFLA